jgi:feruloyl esterase
MRRMRILATGFILAAAIGLAAPALAQTVTRDAAACASLMSLQLPGVPLSITKAEWFAAGSRPPAPPNAPPNAAPAFTLPAYCRLDGVLDKRTGADGKSYGIGFALALPGDWNGRFLFQGGGGLNGNVGFPMGAQASGGTPALVRGFAVVSTDTGHQGRRLRRQLHGRTAGEPRLRLPGRGPGGGAGQADHRAPLRQGSGSLLLRRLLDGWP